MGWLRIDDGFLDHPKVIGLDDRQLRVHLGAMLYAARYRTEGRIPEPALRLIGASPEDAAAFVAAGLWDRIDDVLHVHDFEIYNPKDASAAARAKRYRDAKRDGERDASVTRQRDGGKSKRDAKRDGHGSSRAGARARPVPSPEPLGDGDVDYTAREPDDDSAQRATSSTRAAVDVARDFIRNVGAEIPENELEGCLRVALTSSQGTHSRFEELSSANLQELDDLHRSIAAFADEPA